MNLQNVVLGFDAERVLTLRLEPRGSNQRGPNQVRLMQLYGTLIERARALPGVRADRNGEYRVSDACPWGGAGRPHFRVKGRCRYRRRGERRHDADLSWL